MIDRKIQIAFTMFLAALLLTSRGNADTFTWQGKLVEAGLDADGVYDFQFSLWNADSSGTQIGSTLAIDDVSLNKGLVTVDLDFGGGSFNGDDRWIEVAVKADADGSFTTLTPRQPVNPTPYAMRALTAESSAQWGSSGSAIMNQNGGFVGINRDYAVGLEYFGVHAPVNSGYGGMYITTAGGSALPFYGYYTGTKVGWHYLDGATGDWHLNLNNLNRFTVTDEGNVGIGNTSPQSKLHVGGAYTPTVSGSVARVAGLFAAQGDIVSDGGSVLARSPAGQRSAVLQADASADAGGNAWSIVSNASSSPYGGAAGSLSFYTNGGNPITLSDNGVIELEGSAAAARILNPNNSSASVSLNWLNDVARIRVGGGGIGATNGFDIQTVSNSSLMRISGNGNVGLATTNPETRMHIASGSDVAVASGGFIQFGATTGLNIGIDNNEIMARNNGVASTLHLQADGGEVLIADGDDGELRIGERIALKSNIASAGWVSIRGSNGDYNVVLTRENASADHGWIDVNDANGNPQAGAYVNSAGNGVVWGDTKSFKVPHPDDPSKDIVYVSLEGPEAAMYVRGTATLRTGAATIELPDHFVALAMLEGMTVHLTPLSADSRGLAVVEKQLDRIEVRELMHGLGNYEFDWEVKAVRSAHKNYKPVRDWNEVSPASDLTEAERWENRLRSIEDRKQRQEQLDHAEGG